MFLIFRRGISMNLQNCHCFWRGGNRAGGNTRGEARLRLWGEESGGLQ